MWKRATKTRFRKFLLAITLILIAGLLLPQDLKMPVEGAGPNDYASNSFWYYPWGKSGTHKGVDVFARKGTRIFSSVPGIVIYKGSISMGGNVVLVLGPKWRVHYYAHLSSISTTLFSFVDNETEIGRVGDSGNAKGKPPHLHYSIATLIPYPWRIDGAPQGWKKMWYLNPIEEWK